MAEVGTLLFDRLVIQAVVRVAIRALEKDINNNDLPVVQRASELYMEMTDTPLMNVAVRPRISNRTWYEPNPGIVWDVKRRIKAGNPPEMVRPVVQELLSTRFDQCTTVYTD